MKNLFKKKKKEDKKIEEMKVDKISKRPSMKELNKSVPSSRSVHNNSPISKEDIPMSDNEYKLNHLVETELNVIQKKAKSLHLLSDEKFSENSDDNYWKVSVNEFMKYINQRSQIIIDQLSKKSHAVDLPDEESSE